MKLNLIIKKFQYKKIQAIQQILKQIKQKKSKLKEVKKLQKKIFNKKVNKIKYFI